MLRFAASRPTQSTGDRRRDGRDRGAAARARRAAPSTNAVDDAVARRLRRARAAGGRGRRGDRRRRLPGLRPPAPTRRSLESFDLATAELDPGTEAAPSRTRSRWPRPTGVEAHGIWTVAEQDQAWAHRGPAAGAERRTDAFMKVICIAPNGRSGYASQSAVAVGDARQPAALAERAALKARRRRRAGGAAAGRVPGGVRAAGRRAGCSTCSARRAFNGLAHAEGRGALDGRLGELVAAPAINLSDSPTQRADAPALVRRRGDPEGAAAADPGRRRARGGARRPQRGARPARRSTRPRARARRRPRRPPPHQPRAGGRRRTPTRPSCARRSSAAST